MEITIQQYYITTTWLQYVCQISSSCIAAQYFANHTQDHMVKGVEGMAPGHDQHFVARGPPGSLHKSTAKTNVLIYNIENENFKMIT